MSKFLRNVANFGASPDRTGITTWLHASSLHRPDEVKINVMPTGERRHPLSKSNRRQVLASPG